MKEGSLYSFEKYSQKFARINTNTNFYGILTIQVKDTLYGFHHYTDRPRWTKYTELNTAFTMTSDLAKPMSGRNGPALASFRDKFIFCVGGTTVPGYQHDGATSMYSIDEDKWIAGPTMAVARYYHSCCTLGKMLYAIGGSSQLENVTSIEAVDAYLLTSEP